MRFSIRPEAIDAMKLPPGAHERHDNPVVFPVIPARCRARHDQDARQAEQCDTLIMNDLRIEFHDPAVHSSMVFHRKAGIARSHEDSSFPDGVALPQDASNP